MIFKIMTAFLLSFLLALAAFVPALADEGENEESSVLSSQSIVEDYHVELTEGKLTKDAIADITVRVRNPLLLTENGKNIDITRTSDSFKGGAVSVTVISDDGKPLEYVINFIAIRYTGKGNSLNCFVLYRGSDLPVEPLNITVEECIEYTQPQTKARVYPVPEIQISRSGLADPVKAGESFDVTVTFTNTSAADANGASAVFEPGEGLLLTENKISKRVGILRADSSVSVTVALKAADTLESTPLKLDVTLKYSYETAEGSVEGSATEKLLIPADVSKTTATAKTESATPNIIVTHYDYGKDSVAAGEKFRLTISFRNTSKTTSVDNIVMTVDTGESLSITSASNTYYYSALAPNGTGTQTIEMQVPANAGVTSAKAEISFRYEYVRGNERTSANSTESLSVPVYLPDRFSLTPPEPIITMQGSEVNLSVPYVNRGKGQIGNVEAKIEFADDADAYCEQPSQLLGNIEAGKSGTIDFFFTPNITGVLKLVVVVSYEDEMTDIKTVSLPLTVTVDEPETFEDIPSDEGGSEEPEAPGLPKPAIIGIAAGGALLLISLICLALLRLKRKKQAVNALPEGFDWGEDKSGEQEPRG